MKNIKSIVLAFDQFNFFVTTRAGKSSLIVLMAIFQMVGLTLYGAMIFGYKYGGDAMPYVYRIMLGVFLAFAVEIGVYVSAQNGWASYSKRLYMLSAMLAFLGFGFAILEQTLIEPFSRTVGANGVNIYHFDFKLFLEGLTLLIGQITLSVLPSYTIHHVSVKLYDEYGANKAFKEAKEDIELALMELFKVKAKGKEAKEVDYTKFLKKAS